MLLQLDAYRAAFDEHLATKLGDEPTVLIHSVAAPLAYDIVAYQNSRGSVLVSVGLGRREQPNAHGETPPRVEVLTETSRPSRHVAEVLAAIGHVLHADDRPLDVRYKAFESFRLPTPVHELEHFILVPAIDGTIAERPITVLRVVPADDDEYAHVKMRGDGAARAWWHERKGGSQLRERWAPVMRLD